MAFAEVFSEFDEWHFSFSLCSLNVLVTDRVTPIVTDLRHWIDDRVKGTFCFSLHVVWKKNQCI